MNETPSFFTISGPYALPPMVALAPEDEQARQAHHPQDHPHDQQDEGARDEGEIFKEPSGQRLGHG